MSNSGWRRMRPASAIFPSRIAAPSSTSPSCGASSKRRSWAISPAPIVSAKRWMHGQRRKPLGPTFMTPSSPTTKNRYFADGKLTRHFPFLDLRPSDHPDLVQAVVECANNDPRDRMLALLISSGACATTSSMAPNGRMGFAINARISLTKTRLCGCSNGTANSADAAGTHGRADPDFRKSAFAPLRGRLSPAPEPVVSVDPSCGRPRNAPCRVRVQTGFAVTG